MQQMTKKDVFKMPSMEELHKLDEITHEEKWGIDKKIPITLIGVVIFQTVAITWGAATLSNDVKNYGEKIEKIEINFEKFVEKTDRKYETKSHHLQDKENAFGEIEDIKKDIETLETRVRYLETHLK
jgi:hypothetical protein